jgi:glycosyltransferase involved in cell wall biosynthesis
MQLKIALLTDGIYPFVVGGMQKHSFHLVRFFTEAGYQITLVHGVPETKEIPSREEALRMLEVRSSSNIEIITFHIPKHIYYPGHYIAEQYAYSKMISRKLENRWDEYDLIYAQGFTAWHYLKHRKKATPPVAVHLHGLNMYQAQFSMRSKLESSLLKKAARANLRRADYCFSLGGKLSQILLEQTNTSANVVEIPLGIGSGWLRKTVEPKNRKSFVFVGRNERVKGIRELWIALDRLNRMPEKIDFHFVGPVDKPSGFEEKSVILHFHGMVKNEETIQSILDKCDVLVCPSFSEGMPNVILEAMSRGLAIIATDSGAVSELVSSANGWLIPSGNVPLLTASLSVATTLNSNKLFEMKQTSLERVRSAFSWEQVAKQTTSEIERLAKTADL